MPYLPPCGAPYVSELPRPLLRPPGELPPPHDRPDPPTLQHVRVVVTIDRDRLREELKALAERAFVRGAQP